MKKLLIFGTLDHIPELRKDDYGNTFVTFSVSIEDNKKSKTKSDFIEVSCTGKLADNIINLAYKGCSLFIEGFPAIHTFINNNEVVGIQRLYAHSINILTPKRKPDVR